VNLSELQDAVATSSGLAKKDAASSITALVKVIGDALKEGDKVTVPGLGAFSVAHRAARSGRNPSTGQAIEIAASNKVTFKATKPLTDSLQVQK
jgi:DNA-binding protein HU-beta